MSLIIDGTTIPNKATITYNGNPIEKIICNGVEVWKLQKDVYVYNPGMSGSIFSGCGAYPLTTGYHRPSYPDSSVVWANKGSYYEVTCGYQRVSLLTNSMVDLTPFNYITIGGSLSFCGDGDNGGGWITADRVGTSYGGYSRIVTSGFKLISLNTKTDIREITGSYYIGGYVAKGGSINAYNYLHISSVLLSI